MKLSCLFLPHPHTHKKAHLLSLKALIAYILIFILLQSSLQILTKVKPGVLGVSTTISYQEVIRLTNIERQKYGLPPLAENSMLNTSAYYKAENMYEEDYWSHYSPSGKDPWQFIRGAGYGFTYAGENLARNFYTAQSVVDAWMASPTHRDNILGKNFTEIGISVNEGILQGQKTILVVQHFGKPVEYLAQAQPANTAANINQPVPTPRPPQATPRPTRRPATSLRATSTPVPTLTATPIPTPVSTPAMVAQANTVNLPPTPPTQNKTLVAGWSLDPYQITKGLGFSIIGFLAFLIALDLYIMRRRMVHRFTTHHMSHFALLSVAANALINSGPGQIL